MNNIIYTIFFSTILIGILKFLLDKFLNEIYDNKIKRKVMFLKFTDLYFRFCMIFINFFALISTFIYLVPFAHNNWYSIFLFILLILLITYIFIGIISLILEWELMTLRFNHFNLIQFHNKSNINKKKHFVLDSYDLKTNKIVINNNFAKKLEDDLKDISIYNNAKQYVIHSFGKLETKNLSWDGTVEGSYTNKYFWDNFLTLLPSLLLLILTLLRQYHNGYFLFKNELTVFLTILTLFSCVLIINSIIKYHSKKRVLHSKSIAEINSVIKALNSNSSSVNNKILTIKSDIDDKGYYS